MFIQRFQSKQTHILQLSKILSTSIFVHLIKVDLSNVPIDHSKFHQTSKNEEYWQVSIVTDSLGQWPLPVQVLAQFNKILLDHEQSM